MIILLGLAQARCMLLVSLNKQCDLQGTRLPRDDFLTGKICNEHFSTESFAKTIWKVSSMSKEYMAIPGSGLVQPLEDLVGRSKITPVGDLEI